MLVELTPEEAERILPIVPTRVQYIRYWNDGLRNVGRIVTTVFVGATLLVLSRFFYDNTFFGLLFALSGLLSLLYPVLWGPLYEISRKNLAFREIPYTGLFFGQVLRLRRVTAIVEEQEKLDERGDLYIEEIRERQFEMEIGDEEGNRFHLRVRDDLRYNAIVRRQSVLSLVKAYSRDLQRRAKITEVYVIKLDQWVGDESYLAREDFLALADEVLEGSN